MFAHRWPWPAELHIAVSRRDAQAKGNDAKNGHRLKLYEPVDNEQGIENEQEGEGQAKKCGQPGQQGRDVFCYDGCQQGNNNEVV